MITFSRSLNSVKLELTNEVHFLSPDCFIIAKNSSIYIQSKLATSQPNASYQFAPTEINGRPSDDALVVAEWLRDTYFYGISANTSATGGAILDGSSPSIRATVFDLTNSNPLAAQIVDASGDAITSFGGGDVRITDGGGIVNTKQLGTAVTNSDVGLITNTVIHGLTTAGGGAFVDVKVSPSGALTVEAELETSNTSSITTVAASVTSVTALASNNNRKIASFYNDSSAICYLKLGASATTSSFTVKMAANSFYEIPLPMYTGIVTAIWDSATGNLRVTELT